MKKSMLALLLCLALLLTGSALAEAVSAPVDAPVAEDVELTLTAEAEDATPAALDGASVTKIELGVKEKFTWLPAGEGVTLAYASKNAKIAKVSQSGVITAVKVGKTTIAAMNAEKQTVTLSVTVKKAPARVALPGDKLVLTVGEARAIPATITGNSAGAITYSSSNPDVLSVDSSGNIKALASGTATVTAKTYNGKKATCDVIVINGPAPKTLALNVTAAVLALKQTLTLTPVIDEGSEAVYSFTSADKKIATVSAKGVVTAKKVGTTRITVRTHNGLKATCTVKVCKLPSKVTLNATKGTLKIGESYQLKATLPKNSYAEITWSTSNAAVATVSADGLITAVAQGSATITARTSNGKKATCAVKVTDPSALIDAYAYLGKNLKKSASALGLKKTSMDIGVEYADKAISLHANNTDNVETIWLEDGSETKYCAQGANTGMTLDQAKQALAAQGWTTQDTWKDRYSPLTYNHEGTLNTICLYSNNGKDIANIGCNLDWHLYA